jgi:hypothetical protein
MDINPYKSPESRVEDRSKDLMRWFADAGERAERRHASDGAEYLSKGEKLVYELWLLDTDVQKGGVAQYVATQGLQQWRHCVALVPHAIPSFLRFAERVDWMLRFDPDPTGRGTVASVANGAEADKLYRELRTSIVAELRDVIEPPPEETALDQLRWALSIPWWSILVSLLFGIPILIILMLVLTSSDLSHLTHFK